MQQWRQRDLTHPLREEPASRRDMVDIILNQVTSASLTKIEKKHIHST